MSVSWNCCRCDLNQDDNSETCQSESCGHERCFNCRLTSLFFMVNQQPSSATPKQRNANSIKTTMTGLAIDDIKPTSPPVDDLELSVFTALPKFSINRSRVHHPVAMLPALFLAAFCCLWSMSDASSISQVRPAQRSSSSFTEFSTAVSSMPRSQNLTAVRIASTVAAVPSMCGSPVSTATGYSAKTHFVTVGVGGNLTFVPNTLNAGVGEIVRFQFMALNHTLTQSSLANPCLTSAGFDTGFNEFNPKNILGLHVVLYQVQSLQPQWFFCAQNKPKSHCHAGMTFALNAGSRLKEFQSAARAESTSSVSPTATSLATQSIVSLSSSDPDRPSSTTTTSPIEPSSTVVASGGERSHYIVDMFFAIFLFTSIFLLC